MDVPAEEPIIVVTKPGHKMAQMKFFGLNIFIGNPEGYQGSLITVLPERRKLTIMVPTLEKFSLYLYILEYSWKTAQPNITHPLISATLADGIRLDKSWNIGQTLTLPSATEFEFSIFQSEDGVPIRLRGHVYREGEDPKPGWQTIQGSPGV